jgi:outer membrane protein
LRDEEDQITLEVRQAVRDLRTSRERISATESQVRSSEATLNAETKRLEVGISTSFEVLKFQEDLANAQSQHLRAVTDYNRAAVRLERSAGTLLNTFGVSVEGADLNPQAEPVLFPVGLH